VARVAVLWRIAELTLPESTNGAVAIVFPPVATAGAALTEMQNPNAANAAGALKHHITRPRRQFAPTKRKVTCFSTLLR